MDLPRGFFAGLAQGQQKAPPVLEISVDRLPTVATVQDVVYGTRILDPEPACHAGHGAGHGLYCQLPGLTPGSTVMGLKGGVAPAARTFQAAPDALNIAP